MQELIKAKKAAGEKRVKEAAKQGPVTYEGIRVFDSFTPREGSDKTGM